jgi:hypothetical protein
VWTMIMIVLLLALSGLVACSDNSTGPRTPPDPVLETPTLVLPDSYRTIPLYQVFTDDLSESGLARLYPDRVSGQLFEYEDLWYRGAILDFGTRGAAIMAHNHIFPDRGVGTSYTSLRPLRPFQAVSNGVPHLYLLMDRYVVYVTSRQDLRQPKDLTDINQRLMHEIVDLNKERAIPPPFFVNLQILEKETWPDRSVPVGTMFVVKAKVETALLATEGEPGELTLRISLSRPRFIQETVYPVAAGIDTVAVADSLFLDPETLSLTGTGLGITLTLSPSYISSSEDGPIQPRRMEDGQWKHTAWLAYTLSLQR